MTKPKTIEEILKWMDKNITYPNYADFKSEKRAKQTLNENRNLNCSDRVR